MSSFTNTRPGAPTPSSSTITEDSPATGAPGAPRDDHHPHTPTVGPPNMLQPDSPVDGVRINADDDLGSAWPADITSLERGWTGSPPCDPQDSQYAEFARGDPLRDGPVPANDSLPDTDLLGNLWEECPSEIEVEYDGPGGDNDLGGDKEVPGEDAVLGEDAVPGKDEDEDTVQGEDEDEKSCTDEDNDGGEDAAVDDAAADNEDKDEEGGDGADDGDREDVGEDDAEDDADGDGDGDSDGTTVGPGTKRPRAAKHVPFRRVLRPRAGDSTGPGSPQIPTPVPTPVPSPMPSPSNDAAGPSRQRRPTRNASIPTTPDMELLIYNEVTVFKAEPKPRNGRRSPVSARIAFKMPNGEILYRFLDARRVFSNFSVREGRLAFLVFAAGGMPVPSRFATYYVTQTPPPPSPGPGPGPAAAHPGSWVPQKIRYSDRSGFQGLCPGGRRWSELWFADLAPIAGAHLLLHKTPDFIDTYIPASPTDQAHMKEVRYFAGIVRALLVRLAGSPTRKNTGVEYNPVGLSTGDVDVVRGLYTPTKLHYRRENFCLEDAVCSLLHLSDPASARTLRDALDASTTPWKLSGIDQEMRSLKLPHELVHPPSPYRSRKGRLQKSREAECLRKACRGEFGPRLLLQLAVTSTAVGRSDQHVVALDLQRHIVIDSVYEYAFEAVGDFIQKCSGAEETVTGAVSVRILKDAPLRPCSPRRQRRN